MKFTIIS